MGIKNLTEAEEKEFYRLVGKMNGEETDKEQGVKVRKPRKSEEYFYIVMMELLYKAGGRMIL